MDNKDVEFFNFDDDFNLDDLDFKKSDTLVCKIMHKIKILVV